MNFSTELKSTKASADLKAMMTPLCKLLNYRRALYRWRAAQQFLRSHPANCKFKHEPRPEDYGIRAASERLMAEDVRAQCLKITVKPGKRIGTPAAKCLCSSNAKHL